MNRKKQSVSQTWDSSQYTHPALDPSIVATYSGRAIYLAILPLIKFLKIANVENSFLSLVEAEKTVWFSMIPKHSIFIFQLAQIV